MNNHWACKVTPRAIFTVKSLMNSQIYHRHKIEITNSRNIKVCYLTKIGVLNPNKWSEVSYQKFPKRGRSFKRCRWYLRQFFAELQPVKVFFVCIHFRSLWRWKKVSTIFQNGQTLLNKKISSLSMFCSFGQDFKLHKET